MRVIARDFASSWARVLCGRRRYRWQADTDGDLINPSSPPRLDALVVLAFSIPRAQKEISAHIRGGCGAFYTSSGPYAPTNTYGCALGKECDLVVQGQPL
jgi:hypothetical protein